MMMNRMDATGPIAATYDLHRLNQRPAPAPPKSVSVVPPAFAPSQEVVPPTPMVYTQPTIPLIEAFHIMTSTGIYTPPRQSTGSIFSSMAAPSGFKFASNELMSEQAKRLGYEHGGSFVASSSGLPSDIG
ncbi:MAG: hypothetical protein ACKO34_03945 [Vampirovibrionales bacterium]